ncbi:glycerol-3-phosphate dehydrogenase [Sphingobacterium sp. SGG-5]|uniref:NAD(P)H-dependent glycerol-3-phosphate dehydrogenase n=1 Tax=Sphingobacterium sp. SGG-5 TaxID=2710881 RepID=UPI0013EAAD38|nr:NAD(P)H-dependent glycerol-3-phosphate dehydrogenase [Sphingobacterium sp. SGG-5]NGM61845.1 glycerol-3-phosphate dehydrogenase [Sphingobacterium sp. SGG-5]
MKEISVIGGGSWATALVKILTENGVQVNWFLRRPDQVACIAQEGRNPDYLNHVQLDKSFVYPSTDIQHVIEKSTKILFVVPSAYLESTVDQLDPVWFENKKVMSSIKGTVGVDNVLPSVYLSERLQINSQDQAILAGPCHAEEIARNKKTYLTICSKNEALRNSLVDYFNASYIDISLKDDLLGIEYAAIYKNVIGIACGISDGLHYGDNFKAVLVANAIEELRKLLLSMHTDVDIANSSYIGDLLVTAYSTYSRNRNFGELIGRGMGVEKVKRTMDMVAEGYWATKGLYETAKHLGCKMPILTTIYRILYKHMSAQTEFKILETNIK